MYLSKNISIFKFYILNIKERKIHMNNIVEIWKQVLEIIKPEIPIQVSFTTWIETIIPIDFNNY